MTNQEVAQVKARIVSFGDEQWKNVGDLMSSAMFCENAGLAQAEAGIMVRVADSLSDIARLGEDAMTSQGDLEETIAKAVNRLVLLAAVHQLKSKK